MSKIVRGSKGGNRNTHNNPEMQIKDIFIAARNVLPESPINNFAGCQFNKIKEIKEDRRNI